MLTGALYLLAHPIKQRGSGGGGDDKKKKGKKQATLGAFFGKKDDESGISKGGDDVKDIDMTNLQPIKVDTDLGLPAHDGEGRTVRVGGYV